MRDLSTNPERKKTPADVMNASHTLKLPLRDVSLQTANGGKRSTTPDLKKKLEECLLSPDEIPPTPPQPKRPRLEKGVNENEDSTKLKPRVLLEPKMSTQLKPKEPATLELLKNTKVIKKDFYQLGRHRVMECIRAENGRELHLTVKPQDDTCTAKRTCMLRDFWVHTAVEVGDIVHILSDWHEFYDDEGDGSERTEVAVIDCRSGLIIVRPDLLVSGTSVVSSLFCKRKAVLAERFRSIEPTNRVMLNGTVVHRLLQKVLMEKIYEIPAMRRLVDSLLTEPSILHDLYGAGIALDDLKGDVLKYVPTIGYFVDKHIRGMKVFPPVLPDQQQQKPGRRASVSNPSWDGRIESVCDIEENMWSPWLGIKGKVDLTVKVRHNTGLAKMPLELKTGRSTFSDEHKGQVTLYTMMMNRTRRANGQGNEGDPAGLLLYLKDGAIQSISAGIREKQGLVQLRNEMVRHLTGPTTTTASGEVVESPLPPRIDRIQACASCPLQIECTIYQTTEVPAEEQESLPTMEAIAHLSPAHRRYFLDWSRMLRLEWEETRQRSRGSGTVSDIWCVDPRVRQAQGSCLSHLQVETSGPSQSPSEMSQYNIKLVPIDGQPFPEHVTLQPGDNVVLSTDTEVAVATGCLVQLGPASATVATDRNVNNWDRNFSVLHLDRLEYQGGQSLLYSNLSRLMANNQIAARLRELVIDRATPTFEAGIRRSDAEKCKPILARLNHLQKRAVLKALVCKDYCLVKGLPGTGKTSLIVAFIRLAVLLGKTILLTSYTHSAVDNVLLKLAELQGEDRVDFLRIGREHRTHPSILPYSAEIKSRDCRTVEDLERLYRAPVIATTCLGVGHPALHRRRFDFCVVDEAAQALQLAVIGPLTSAQRFVLVGDPQQLPPVVQSRAAKSMGMDESLFVRLSQVDSGGSAVAPLHEQYRMCGPVNELANALTYAGDLKCGGEGVEQATLALPRIETVRPTLPVWLYTVIQPGLIHALIFLDTSLLADELKCHSGTGGHSPVVNRLEAGLAVKIVTALKDAGLPCDRVGIIAPYQSQVQHLRHITADRDLDGLEINTVDQYQGRDKEAVLYSCTKSEPISIQHPDSVAETDNQQQTILHDLRRLTVAVTRAKHKLLILGDGLHLRRYPPFARLLDAIEPHQRYQLCAGADGFQPNDVIH